MLVNAYRTFRTPVYDTHLLPGQFDQECERLWRHINKLLPPAGYPVSQDSLDGKPVVVVGVGSTFGFFLLLYAMGAKLVVAVDPFLRAILSSNANLPNT